MPLGLSSTTWLFCKVAFPGEVITSLASLDSPVGGETAALIKEHRLDTRLLRCRPHLSLCHKQHLHACILQVTSGTVNFMFMAGNELTEWCSLSV